MQIVLIEQLRFKLKKSDFIIEHRGLDTRTFQLHFGYSNFRVFDSSNRVSYFQIDGKFE